MKVNNFESDGVVDYTTSLIRLVADVWVLQSFYWIAKNKKQISKYKINPKNNKDTSVFSLR